LSDGIRRGGDCACGGGENWRTNESGLSALGGMKDCRIGDSGGVGVFAFCGGEGDLAVKSSTGDEALMGDWCLMMSGDSTRGGVGDFALSGGLNSLMNCSNRSGDATRGGVGVFVCTGGDSTLGGVGVLSLMGGDSTRGGVGVFSLSGGDSTRGGVGVFIFSSGDSTLGGVGVFSLSGSGGGDSTLLINGGVTSRGGGVTSLGGGE
jgi:hypothetical protein